MQFGQTSFTPGSRRFVSSIIIDGGLTYVAYHGLKTLSGHLNRDPKATNKSEGYRKADAEMQEQKQQDKNIKADTGQDRGYSRSGHPR